MKRQGGFTLIELVVVIVILGLLAATALPKFIDITTDARVASVQGVAGGLRAAAALGQAQYVVNGDKTATTISMGGSNVTVLDENGNLGLGGRPTGDSTGIQVAMPDPDGFGLTTSGAGFAYTPNGSTPATCSASYDPTLTGDAVDVITTGC